MEIKISVYALDDIGNRTCYPHTTLSIVDTMELSEIMDDIRINQGLLPFFKGENSIDTAWYDFYADINVEEGKIESVYAVSFSEDNEYNGWTAELPIDKWDAMKQIIDELRNKFHMSLNDLKERCKNE